MKKYMKWVHGALSDGWTLTDDSVVENTKGDSTHVFEMRRNGTRVIGYGYNRDVAMENCRLEYLALAVLRMKAAEKHNSRL